MQVARSRPFLVACALLVVGGLFAPWTTLADGEVLVLFGALDQMPDPERTGWEELAWLDAALVLVAVAVVTAAFVPAARLPAAALALGGAIAVVILGLAEREPAETEVALLGPALCLTGLLLGAAALFVRGRPTDS